MRDNSTARFLPTQERVRELFNYDPETGIFTWRISRTGSIRVGQVAGTVRKVTGYVRIHVDGKFYYAHRLAWLYMTGEWPAEEIDHINRQGGDNRFANLRPASRAQNGGNTSIRRRNKSGVKGVSWYKRGRKWKAQIMMNGKNCSLGCFNTISEAAAAYAAAAELCYGEYACTDSRVPISPTANH
ncbi:HNH endonuclease signature motif containing protein [Azospirillum melinis]|uniref:HNH endonuclease signature motif containing protein n=1 Tax=Azospirillum melinis TaxID=328839 RepID=UPI003756491B